MLDGRWLLLSSCFLQRLHLRIPSAELNERKEETRLTSWKPQSWRRLVFSLNLVKIANTSHPASQSSSWVSREFVIGFCSCVFIKRIWRRALPTVFQQNPPLIKWRLRTHSEYP